MPYYRRRKSYRRWGSKRGFKHVAAGQSLIKHRYGKAEEKYLDYVTPSATAVGYGAEGYYLFPLSGLTQGTTANSRQGNMISKKAIRLNYVTTAGAGSTTGCILRCMLVEDKFPNGSTFNAGSLGSALLVQSTTGNAVFSPSIPEKTDRFRVLYDMQHVIPPASQDTSQVPHSVVVPVRTATVFTNGNTCTDASIIARGALYFLCFSNVALAGTPPTVQCYSRLIFTDA